MDFKSGWQGRQPPSPRCELQRAPQKIINGKGFIPTELIRLVFFSYKDFMPTAFQNGSWISNAGGRGASPPHQGASFSEHRKFDFKRFPRFSEPS